VQSRTSEKSVLLFPALKMTYTIGRLRHKSLLLTILLNSLFAYVALPAGGEISNTASAGGDNLTQNVNSNTVTLTAGQAQLQLLKTADKAAAEPGDTVIYRLQIKNNGNAATSNLTVTDTLPFGLSFRPKTVQGSVSTSTGYTPVTLTTAANGQTVTINSAVGLPAKGILNVIYGAQITPDARRGNRNTIRNLAIANAGNLRSNQASHLLRIRPGILSDCGTIIGRVFIDKNFDGEQQRGEPGVPNAVVYLDDGTRIVTDANGLYSLGNVISGTRTATLDLTSVPGYSLAPNHYFIEKNSQSRMVKLAPGGMVRINFAVTPASARGKQ